MKKHYTSSRLPYANKKKQSLLSCKLRTLFSWSIFALSGFSMTLPAQTRFEEPQDVFSMSEYNTVEQCLVAVWRINEVVNKRGPIQRFLASPEESKVPMEWPDSVIRTAQRCSSQWNATTAPLNDFGQLFELFLIAGRRIDASVLLSRRIVKSVADGDSLAISVIDSAMSMYFSARPLHLRELDSLVKTLLVLPDTGSFWYWKISRLWFLRDAAGLVGNDSIFMWAARQADDRFAALTDAQRLSPWYVDPRIGSISKAKDNSLYLNFPEAMDSLARSTQAYVSLMHSLRERLTKNADPYRDDRLDVGAVAPNIDADIWFPVAPTNSRPSKGELSLIVPLADCRMHDGKRIDGNETNYCEQLFTSLKRLKDQFPALEITILSSQEGRAILSEPGTFELEADDMQRWFLGGSRLPITLAVEKADFVRLPDPDSRFVNTRWTLDVMHDYGCYTTKIRGGEINCRGAYLVDKEGVIIRVASLFNPSIDGRVKAETTLISMLNALTKREN